MSRCQKKSSSGPYGASGDTRGRHTDNPAGRHSIPASQRPTSLVPPPHFYAGCPSCCNPPNLSWLGTGTEYAGLHAQWLGLFQYPVAWFVPKENLCDNWHRYFTGPMSFLSSSQKCQSGKRNKALSPAGGPTTSFLCSPPDSRWKRRCFLYAGCPIPAVLLFAQFSLPVCLAVLAAMWISMISAFVCCLCLH